jgi:two-component system response regulator FixJ
MRPEPAAQAGEPRLPGLPPAAAAGRLRVLLVDDDPSVRASLKFALELEEFDVEDFASAESLATRAELPGRFCLIIDYRLPGMNGLQLLALLRSRGSQAPAIIITSNPTRKLRQAIAEAGAVLIEKPLLCDALSASVRALCRGEAR